MIEISEEYIFYQEQYKKALIFSDNIDCQDLIEEFDTLALQYLQTKDKNLYQKFDDNI